VVETNRASMETILLKISGMTCAACSSRVERALAKLPGIEKAAVNLATEKASVTYERSLIGLNEITRKIEDLGYQVIKDKVELKITGMTCAACSGRIERVLNKMPGIAGAIVNLAVEKATVEYYPGVVSLKDIKAKIENIGFGVHDLSDKTEAGQEQQTRQAEVSRQRFRLGVAAVFSLPLLLAMVLHMLGVMGAVAEFLMNPYVQLILATPVQFIAALIWMYLLPLVHLPPIFTVLPMYFARCLIYILKPRPF
jgi:Cu+-exporting ATPase